jgi:hypothetical protein
MSEESSQLLDKLKQKKEPAVKKPVKIKYAAKSKEEVKITTKISDKRPVANINRESILQKIGIRPTVTSQISSKKITEEEDEFKLGTQMKALSISKPAEPTPSVKPEIEEDDGDDDAALLAALAEAEKSEEKVKSKTKKPLSKIKEELEEELEDQELDEEALLAALEDAEEMELKPKKETSIKPKKTSTKKITGKSVTKVGDTLLSEAPKNAGDLQKLLPDKKPKILIQADSYYLNNREVFVNFINDLLKDYKSKLSDSKEYSCDDKGDGNFSLLTHQNIVRDYINLLTPYRGLLLYHGLGSGKTCSSIAIAEGIKSDKEVLILLPKSLEVNYKQELKKCGDELYRNNQYWEKINTVSNPELVDPLAYILSLSPKFITKQGGAWFVNKSKEPNYNLLTAEQQKSLNEQIEKMLENKYKFIRYNGLRRKKFDEMVEKAGGNPFSNKIIVVDEAHNLVSKIVNQLQRPDSLSMDIYKYLQSAENTRIVLLTGTPIINYPHEIAIMMNILRGNIKTWKFQLNNKGKSGFKLTQDSLIKLFKENLDTNYLLDYLNFKSTPQPTLTITRNPYGFYTKNNKKGEYVGVSGGVQGEIDDTKFLKLITEELLKKNVEIVQESVEVINYKCLPDKKDEFSALFVNQNSTKPEDSVTNMELFKRRILGLVSYFPDIEALLPKFEKDKDFNLVLVPMSNFQFAVYEEARVEERKIERNNAKKKGRAQGNDIYENSVSTYRVFSRAFCNFVFPRPDIIRPLPRDSKNLADVITETANEDLLDAISEEDRLKEEGIIDSEVIDDVEKQSPKEQTATSLKENISYAAKQRKALQDLYDKRDEYLNPQALEIYSPKFLNILQRLLDERNIGSHLIYSQFRQLEGIGILSIVLEANGFAQFKIVKTGGVWKLNIKPEDMVKPKFVLYTGTELPEEKEIIRNIFNSNWDALNTGETSSLKEQLIEMEKTNPVVDGKKIIKNYFGDIIKVIMITASGAEGISLSNVRYVHITEPYWHPVRINQVIGRARRICSHKNLPLEYQTVEVFLYLMEFTEEQIEKASRELKTQDKSKFTKEIYMNYKSLDNPYLTSDQSLYEISNQKEVITQGILKNIKEASIDCNLHNPIGTSKQLKCLVFGSDNPNKFAYAPSISSQEKDEAAQLNRTELKIKLKKVTLPDSKGTKTDYAYNAAVLEDPSNENSEGIIVSRIYTLDSAAAENPVPIGSLYFKNQAKPGEAPKYKPVDFTFLAQTKK